MSKRTDYSKVSLKAKMPKSIRYNIMDFELACEISGRTTVQSLWDYLLAKYLAENGRIMVSPIDMIDKRPIDNRIFEVTNADKFTEEMKLFHYKRPQREIVGGIVATKEMTTDKEIDDWMKSVMKPKPSELMRNPPPKGSKEWFEAVQIDQPEVDDMPMWTPKPKTEAEKAAEKAKAEQVAAKELERLKEIQEYKERIKGKKK